MFPGTQHSWPRFQLFCSWALYIDFNYFVHELRGVIFSSCFTFLLFFLLQEKEPQRPAELEAVYETMFTQQVSQRLSHGLRFLKKWVIRKFVLFPQLQTRSMTYIVQKAGFVLKHTSFATHHSFWDKNGLPAWWKSKSNLGLEVRWAEISGQCDLKRHTRPVDLFFLANAANGERTFAAESFSGCCSPDSI